MPRAVCDDCRQINPNLSRGTAEAAGSCSGAPPSSVQECAPPVLKQISSRLAGVCPRARSLPCTVLHFSDNKAAPALHVCKPPKKANLVNPQSLRELFGYYPFLLV